MIHLSRRQILMIELDIRWRWLFERTRWRLLRLIPRRVVYFVLIRAWADALGPHEHPDDPTFSQMVRRWQ